MDKSFVLNKERFGLRGYLISAPVRVRFGEELVCSFLVICSLLIEGHIIVFANSFAEG